MRVLATDLLARLGYRVLQAENGQAGLHVAEELAGDIRLALTDVIMPEMNGKEFATRLASSHSSETSSGLPLPARRRSAENHPRPLGKVSPSRTGFSGPGPV